MADNNNESEGLFSLRNLLFLLLSAILSGLLVFQSNWEPKRPAPEKDPRHEEGIQLDARLWMDPLEIPRRDPAGDASHATGEADFGGQIIRHLTDQTNKEKNSGYWPFCWRVTLTPRAPNGGVEPDMQPFPG